MQIKERILLAEYSTFHIGGPAQYFAAVRTLDDIREALMFAKDRHLPVFVLGGGSNVLCADEGFSGVVLKVELAGVHVEKTITHVRMTAAAGESWDALVARAVQEGGWGIENLSGIPGTVGGACIQNIGAYGAALSQTLETVEVFDTHESVTKILTNADCRFGYRGSLFKDEPGRYIVLSATFALKINGTPDLSYRDLQTRFENDIAASVPLTLLEIREAVVDIRRNKFPDITQEGTAGSFFKNPMVSPEQAEALKEKYPDIPLFSMPETMDIKVPLGWLLDKVLMMHGMRVGGARVFEKQALVIATAAGTSARDVKELVSFIEKKVFDELKIKIEPEVKIL